MVGTNPTRTPARSQLWARRCIAATDFTTRIGEIEKRRECYFAPRKISLLVLVPEMKRRSLRHLVGTWLVGRRIGRAFILLHEVIGEEKSFDFFATDVRQHF